MSSSSDHRPTQITLSDGTKVQITDWVHESTFFRIVEIPDVLNPDLTHEHLLLHFQVAAKRSQLIAIEEHIRWLRGTRARRRDRAATRALLREQRRLIQSDIHIAEETLPPLYVLESQARCKNPWRAWELLELGDDVVAWIYATRRYLQSKGRVR